MACISEGETLVNSTSETLGTIARQAQQMAELVTEMSSATTEQSVGIEEINRAMTQLEQVTQQNATLTPRGRPPGTGFCTPTAVTVSSGHR
ncbi:methyl-accepting chemotaxis protein [Vreelandella rituensis]|uniref:Methyl-accepting transducer domain-containing protein n=1 Tax=Vreelandella rituensis TaxID=2282306 RepID=A0A368TQK1_9GAMM|nr:methyl-accepting chemotaxis protein [Halomonas rituensis]RCV86586.1 hypothetical protein DU506_18165 [Halomonas rituensis]